MTQFTKVSYTNEAANKAVSRHQKRTPNERTTLLRALLCDAASDSSPTFEGVDPIDGPYKGPTVTEWTVSTLGYFLFRKMPLKKALRLLEDGYLLAQRHEESSAAWRKQQEVYQ